MMGIDLLLIDAKTGAILKKKRWDETISLQGDPMTGQYSRPSPGMALQGFCSKPPCGRVAHGLDTSPYMSTEASAEATPFRLLANEVVQWLEKLPPPVRETKSPE